MSGKNWIRVDADLRSSQEFLVITDRVARSATLPDFVVENFVLGCLARLWLYCDSHGWLIEEGEEAGDAIIEEMTPRLLARAIGDSGRVVVDALIDVGWLIQTESGVRLPNIGRRSPKGCSRNRTKWARRASRLAVQTRRSNQGQNQVNDPGQQEQIRVKQNTDFSRKPHIPTESLTESVTDRETTEQNRTEQDLTEMVKPQNGSTEPDQGARKQRSTAVKLTDQQFESFWTEVPRKVKKANSRKRLQLVVRDLLKAGDFADVEAAVTFMVEQARTWRKFQEQAGTEPRFIPYPTTWLNERRWEDYVNGSNSRSDEPPAEFEEIVGQYLDRSLRGEFGPSAPLLWKRDEASFRKDHPELWKWARRHRSEFLTAIEPQGNRPALVAEMREVTR